MKKALLVLGLLFIMAGVCSAELILDISGSQYETQNSDTVRIRNVVAPGYAGKYWGDFKWDKNLLVFVPINVGAENSTPTPTDPTIAKLELLKGKWHFVYTIISTFTNDYTLKTIQQSTTDGSYFIAGTDQYGGTVVALYDKDAKTGWHYSLLDPGSLFDTFFIFDTDGSTIQGGCYYQVYGSGSTLTFSNCYSLSGSKTSTSTASSSLARDSKSVLSIQKQMISEVDLSPVDDETAATYRLLKSFSE